MTEVGANPKSRTEINREILRLKRIGFRFFRMVAVVVDVVVIADERPAVLLKQCTKP